MWSSAGSAGIVFSTRSAHAEVSWIFFFKPFLALFVMFSWFFGFLLILDVVSLVCCFVLWSSLVLGCSLLQIKDWIFSSCCFRVWLDWATNYWERKEREKENLIWWNREKTIVEDVVLLILYHLFNHAEENTFSSCCFMRVFFIEWKILEKKKLKLIEQRKETVTKNVFFGFFHWSYFLFNCTGENIPLHDFCIFVCILPQIHT